MRSCGRLDYPLRHHRRQAHSASRSGLPGGDGVTRGAAAGGGAARAAGAARRRRHTAAQGPAARGRRRGAGASGGAAFTRCRTHAPQRKQLLPRSLPSHAPPHPQPRPQPLARLAASLVCVPVSAPASTGHAALVRLSVAACRAGHHARGVVAAGPGGGPHQLERPGPRAELGLATAALGGARRRER